jgi:CRP/FNR family transcriptional regulator, cyclic AMP receptor protein
VTTIALLDADPDLADSVGAADLIHARNALVAPVLELEAGPWTPAHRHDVLGLLVIEGVLLREVTAGEVVSMELLGPGDLIVPGTDGTSADFVEAAVQWSALAPTQLAVVRPELVQRLSDWPGVLSVIVSRMAERSSRQAVMQAICHNPRVDVRLRGLFWHLANRWGRVSPAGVVLPLRLTHDALARLVGAQRPTVSTALKSLENAGEVSRRRDGAWVLLPESQERLHRVHERVTNARSSIELINATKQHRQTMAEQLERLQTAWEQQSASLIMLRQRAAELRAEARLLRGSLTEFRGNGSSQDSHDGAPGDPGDASRDGGTSVR